MSKRLKVLLRKQPPHLRDPWYGALGDVIATPHISGTTDVTSRRRAACAAENIERFAEGLDPLHRVDQTAEEAFAGKS